PPRSPPLPYTTLFRSHDGLDDDWDEVIRAVIPFHREFQGTHERRASDLHAGGFFRQEFVHVGGDALISMRAPEDQDSRRRDLRRSEEHTSELQSRFDL